MGIMTIDLAERRQRYIESYSYRKLELSRGILTLDRAKLGHTDV